MMPLLYLGQSVEGMISREVLREVGELLGITTAEVEAVASFYSMYRLRPTGTHVVNMCTNLPASSAVPREVYEAAHGRPRSRTGRRSARTVSSRCTRRSASGSATSRPPCRWTSRTTTR